MMEPAKNLPRPTDVELEILNVLWSRGASTVREIHEAVSSRRSARYTTVLKHLQIMTEKGLVERDEKKRAHRYEASRPREWTQQQLAGDLLRRAFGGSAKSLMLGALTAKRASREELDEMRRLLDEYEEPALADSSRLPGAGFGRFEGQPDPDRTHSRTDVPEEGE